MSASEESSDISLPQPDEYAKTHSDRLRDSIIASIREHGGKITFSEYMNQALYSPGLGYYTAGTHKFGREGDFITAPEISPLFSQCLALNILYLLREGGLEVILEAGAGSGTMAVEIMRELERQDNLPREYQILELSPDLKQRQRQRIENEIPHLASCFTWLDRLPEPGFKGIVLANELLDAMPVHLLTFNRDTIQERYVGAENDRFVWIDSEVSDSRLLDKAQFIQNLHDKLVHLKDRFDPVYVCEINLNAMHWLSTFASLMEQGAFMLIDYGYPEREFFHPQRTMGTLMCHFQHHRHDDPFLYPGLQDITAHVDFTELARTATQAGLNVSGFTTQANFLMGSHLLDLAARTDPSDTAAMAEAARQIKLLTLPNEMGELFKFILLTRNIPLSLPGFQYQDLRHRL